MDELEFGEQNPKTSGNLYLFFFLNLAGAAKKNMLLE
jgi:hypothetical protein